MGEAVVVAAAATTAGTRHTAHDTRGTRGNGIRRPYTVLGRKDTCCTALWVAVSGLCDSLSSVRICLSPSSCGCHAIFIVFFNSTTVTRSLPSLTSQINGSSPQRSHSLPLSFARLPSTAAARPIPALSLAHPCERAPSGPWSRKGAPRPSSAPAARSPRETPAFPFRRRPSRHFSRAPLFRSFGKIRDREPVRETGNSTAATARRRVAFPREPLAMPRAWKCRLMPRLRKCARWGILKPDSRPVQISGVSARIGAGKRALRPTTEINRDRCGMD